MFFSKPFFGKDLHSNARQLQSINSRIQPPPPPVLNEPGHNLVSATAKPRLEHPRQTPGIFFTPGNKERD